MTANIIAAMPRILSPFIVSSPLVAVKSCPPDTPEGRRFFHSNVRTFFGAVTTRPKAASGTTRPTDTFALTSAFKGNSGRDIGPLIRLPRGARALAPKDSRFRLQRYRSTNGDRRGRCFAGSLDPGNAIALARRSARHDIRRAKLMRAKIAYNYNECKLLVGEAVLSRPTTLTTTNPPRRCSDEPPVLCCAMIHDLITAIMVTSAAVLASSCCHDLGLLLGHAAGCQIFRRIRLSRQY